MTSWLPRWSTKQSESEVNENKIEIVPGAPWTFIPERSVYATLITYDGKPYYGYFRFVDGSAVFDSLGKSRKL